MLSEREKFVVLLDSIAIRKADILVLLEGDGLNRIDVAVKLLTEKFSSQLLFSGGYDNPINGSYPYELIKPVLIAKGVDLSQIIIESESLNTHEQAVNTLKLCLSNDWNKIILIASNYHQYRAFLTFYKEILRLGLERKIELYVAKNYLPWFKETGYGKRVDLLDKEFEKIETYLISADNGLFSKAINYLQWLEVKESTSQDLS